MNLEPFTSSGFFHWSLLYKLENIGSFSWSYDSRYLAVKSDDNLSILDAKSGEVVQTIQAINQFVWSPVDYRIAGNVPSTGIFLWDAISGKIINEFDIGSGLGWSEIGKTIAWSPDGERLAFATSSNSVQIWNVQQGQYLYELDQFNTDYIGGLFWSPSGRFIASQAGYQVVIWAADTGRFIFLLAGHEDNVWDVSWSPVEDYLASTSWDGTVRVWDINTGVQLKSISTGMSLIPSVVSWSPKQLQLVFGGGDISPHVIDLPSDNTVQKLEGGPESTVSLSWSPNNRYIAGGASSTDGILRIWQSDTGKLVSKLKGWWQIQWSPNGELLASSDQDGNLFVWSIPSPKLALSRAGE